MFAVLIQKFILSIFLWAFYWSLLEFWDTVPVPVSLLLAVFYKKSKKFGNSIKQVIFEPGAFTAIDDGQFYMEPDESSYEAVQAALRGWDPTGGALYYWNPVTATSKWVWSRPIINQIGKHVFAL